MHRIVEGNSFELVIIGQEKTGGTVENIDLSPVDELAVYLIKAGRGRKLMAYTINEAGEIVMSVDAAEVSKGIYGVEVIGKIEDTAIHAQQPSAFQIVDGYHRFGDAGAVMSYEVNIVMIVNTAANKRYVDAAVAAEAEARQAADEALGERIDNAGKVDDVLIDGVSILDPDTKEANIPTSMFGKVDDVKVNDVSVLDSETKEANINITASVVENDTPGTPTANATMQDGNINIEFEHVKGERGNGIASVTEELSNQDGGINTHTITDDDGHTHTIHTRNGQTGRPGADRQPVESGDVIIAHDLGADEGKVMSQKGVTDAFVNANSFAWKQADYTKKSDLDISNEGEVSTSNYRYLFCVQVSVGDVVQMNGTGPTTGEDPKVVVALFDDLPKNGDTAIKVLAESNTVNGEYSGVFSATAAGYLVMRLWGTTSNITAFKAQSVKEALTDVKATVDYIGNMEVTGWESQDVEKLSKLKISNDGTVSSYNYRYIFYAQVDKGDVIKVLGSNQADEPIIVALFDEVPAAGSVATAVLDNSPAVDGEYENTFRIASNGYCAISMYGTNTVGKMQKATKIQDLVKTVKGESIEPTYNTTSGHYITKNGGIGSSSGFSYTSPIAVRAGDKVSFSSDCGTSGSCSCIALTDAQGTAYRSQMAEKGFAKRSYDVMEDGYVALSYITAKGLTIVINRNSMVAAVERMQSVADTLMVDSRDGTIIPSGNPLARLISGPSRVRTFKSYGIIGASFETGYTNANLNGEASPFYDEGYEWPTLMGKVNGVEVYNYALAGHAFKQWLRDRNDTPPNFQATNLPWDADTHQPECFIINMSSNDLDSTKNPDPAGDALDIDSSVDYSLKEYNEHASFAEVVTAIIQLCRKKSPKCHIFVATVRGGIGSDEERKAELNETLKGVAGLFERCHVLDIFQYGMDWSKSGYLSGSNTSHPTRLGHVYLADQFNTYIDWYIGKYPELFKDAAYIGTDYQLP